MDVLEFLIPLALVLGLVGLVFFIWSIKTGQYDDLEGAAQRILIEDDAVSLPKGHKDSVELTSHEDSRGES
ncbi:MAG: cbb3-type cytochrome oxidase assembly protein CcoS [Pseudobdellovibrionaceae bacterium]|jgi:cbb3-type cytochrome oxidase maturation protein|nr:cbb3-type cytochrome oxidase assembly protein CcoS [Pseudobdellovibrionaceae bacterium]